MSRSRLAARLWSDTRGTTLVELALVIPLFLLLFLGLLEAGRLHFEWVEGQKATQVAARIAAVRPPACAGVPTSHARASGATAVFGTRCNAGGAICVATTVTCLGNASNATVAEIWAKVGPVLPPAATPADLRFTYATDPDLGFLGGPFVPVVTVALDSLDFTFAVTGFANLIGVNLNGTTPASQRLPSMSVSLPAEDLALGTNG